MKNVNYSKLLILCGLASGLAVLWASAAPQTTDLDFTTGGFQVYPCASPPMCDGPYLDGKDDCKRAMLGKYKLGCANRYTDYGLYLCGGAGNWNPFYSYCDCTGWPDPSFIRCRSKGDINPLCDIYDSTCHS